ncbi:MAG: Dabb family protein [Chloroflexota bacterium]|nr:Dabb family protein [Chloroflexota bacterium]
MIRHVSVFTLKDGVDVRRVTTALDEIRDRVPGPIAHAYGPDAGLRAGNGGFGVSFDFDDEAAYRAWDTNPEHERIRRESILPLLAGVVRCQFRV